MTPRVGADTHWFAEQGLYDGLFLMKDEETGTFWDHMTGEAVYGPLVGETLQVDAGLIQTTVEQVLRNAPDAQVTISDQAIRSDDDMKVGGLISGIRGRLNRMFQSTVAEDDARRPQMDMGLGLWEGESARYYPLDIVRSGGRAVLDDFGSGRVVVMIDPNNFVLTAFRTSAENAEWDGDVLKLSDGTSVEGGVLRDANGQSVGPRPLQVFTRWYGFSLTFPETEVYGEGR